MGNSNLHRSRGHRTECRTMSMKRADTRRYSPPGLAMMVALSVLLISPVGEAKIYKWVDADGVTQYTQHPPPEEFVTEEIKTSKQSAGAAAQANEALQKRVDALDERRSDKKLKQDEGEPAVADRKKREEYCAAERARLADFESGRRLAEEQEDGSYLPVTEEQRTEEIGKMQARIKAQCN